MEPSLLNKRAQLFSMDIMVAVLLAIVMTGIVAFYWNASVNEINTRQERAMMQRDAFDVTSYLIRIKLVNSSNVFEKSKLLEFAECDYNATRDEIGISGYDFYIKLAYMNNSIVSINGTSIECGLNYTYAENLMVTRRIGVLNSTEVLMYMYTWR